MNQILIKIIRTNENYIITVQQQDEFKMAYSKENQLSFHNLINPRSLKFSNIVRAQREEQFWRREERKDMQSVIERKSNLGQRGEIKMKNSENEEYMRVQKKIKSDIEEYNKRVQQLRQTLNDMQIRDLLRLNQEYEENQRKYAGRNIIKESWQRKVDANQMLQGVKNILAVVLRYSTESTLSAKSVETCQPSCVSPRQANRLSFCFGPSLNKMQYDCNAVLIAANFSNKPILNSLDNVSINSLGKVSNHSKCKNAGESNNLSINSLGKMSFGSVERPESPNKMVNHKQCVFEDTPQSLKSGCINIANNSKLAVAMFDKIDICESVNLQLQDYQQNNLKHPALSPLQKKQNLSNWNIKEDFKGPHRYRNVTNLETDR